MKMKPSSHSGTTMLTLSSHVIYMQFGEFKICSPFNKCEKRKNDVWRESMLSKKKRFTDFHPTPADSWIRQASKRLGPWHQAPLLPAPWSSWIWGARGVVWMSLSSISIKLGSTIRDSPFGMTKKQHVCLFGMRLSEIDMHHPIFLFQKVIGSKCQRWYKQPCFKPLCQHVCQPVDIENFPSVSVPPAYKTFQFRCRLESATCPTKPQKEGRGF